MQLFCKAMLDASFQEIHTLKTCSVSITQAKSQAVVCSCLLPTTANVERSTC